MYPYKDHLGNIRINYTWDDEANELTVLNEHHYYPFGLEHTAYNTTKREFKKGESNNHPVLIEPVENSGYQYKYQGQERQDELNLNWDSFKWRNYDYAIGRFMSIDPLAEKYAYNSTYAFQENKMGLGVELEGLELYRNPNRAIAEGFRQYFDAIASLFKVKAGVKHVSTKPVANANIGKTGVSATNNTVTKFQVSIDASSFFDYYGNNDFNLESRIDNIVKVETTTTMETVEKVETEVVVDGVPFNVSNTTKGKSTGEKSNTTEVNCGISTNSVDANIFVNTTTTTSSDGNTISSSSVGARINIPVNTDGDSETKEKVGAYIQIETNGN